MMPRPFTRRLLIAACALALPLALPAQDAAVQVMQPDLHGSRQLEPLTANSVVRDYLQSWRSMSKALNQNAPQVLHQDFVGTALTRLTQTIADQNKLGIHTRYTDQSHRLQIVFYSPDGLSIELIDSVDYTEQVMQGGTVIATQPIHARNLVVLTPSQTSWQVRLFQASEQQ